MIVLASLYENALPDWGLMSIDVGREGGGQAQGGPTYPPLNNPPTFSFNFYVKQEKITNVPS